MDCVRFNRENNWVSSRPIFSSMGQGFPSGVRPSTTRILSTPSINFLGRGSRRTGTLREIRTGNLLPYNMYTTCIFTEDI
jgi:hypothetical protein